VIRIHRKICISQKQSACFCCTFVKLVRHKIRVTYAGPCLMYLTYHPSSSACRTACVACSNRAIVSKCYYLRCNDSTCVRSGTHTCMTTLLFQRRIICSSNWFWKSHFCWHICMYKSCQWCFNLKHWPCDYSIHISMPLWTLLLSIAIWRAATHQSNARFQFNSSVAG
jgi:hypothetical protein